LKLHRDFIPPSSRLSLLIPVSSNSDTDPYHVNLRHIASDAGHILVQYLYTGKYQALEAARQPAEPQSGIVTFRTAVQVYVASRDLQFDDLISLVEEEITILGESLDIFSIIDVVKQIYPSPTADDTWFPNFVTERLSAALADPVALLKIDVPGDFSDGMSIAKFIIQGVFQVYAKRLEDSARKSEEAAAVKEEMVAEIKSRAAEKEDMVAEIEFRAAEMEAMAAEKEAMEAEKEEMVAMIEARAAEMEAMVAEKEEMVAEIEARTICAIKRMEAEMAAEKEVMTNERDGLLGRLKSMDFKVAAGMEELACERVDMAAEMQDSTSGIILHRSRAEDTKQPVEEDLCQPVESSAMGGTNHGEHLPSLPSLGHFSYSNVEYLKLSDSELEAKPDPPVSKKSKKDKKSKKSKKGKVTPEFERITLTGETHDCSECLV